MEGICADGTTVAAKAGKVPVGHVGTIVGGGKILVGGGTVVRSTGNSRGRSAISDGGSRGRPRNRHCVRPE